MNPYVVGVIAPNAQVTMIIKYPVNTKVAAEAIQVAQNMARSHGFKLATVIEVKQTADTEWLITLNVMK